MPSQPLDQLMDLLVNVPAVGRQRAERQTAAQMLGTLRCARAELAQADPMAAEAGDDFPVRARFEDDVSGEPGA
jgi:recombinational DNA repair protein RecR